MNNNNILSSIKVQLIKTSQKLDQLGRYKTADKFMNKYASILMMAIKLKEDLENAINDLYNYYDERTLNELLSQSNVLVGDGDISYHMADYRDLFDKLRNVETISPEDLQTQNFSSLDNLKQNLINTVETIDKLNLSISHAHDNLREQKDKLDKEIIPDE